MGLLMMNGIPYAGYTAPPEIYSLEEREVGVWIDGKPLYQRTYYINNQQDSFSDYADIATLDSTMEVKNISGCYKRSVNDLVSYMPIDGVYTYVQGVFGIDVRTYENKLQYYIHTYSGSEVTDIYVTLQYTKTTDTAGSGKWSPDGSFKIPLFVNPSSLLNEVSGTVALDWTATEDCLCTIYQAKLGSSSVPFLIDGVEVLTFFSNVDASLNDSIYIKKGQRVQLTNTIYKIVRFFALQK